MTRYPLINKNDLENKKIVIILELIHVEEVEDRTEVNAYIGTQFNNVDTTRVTDEVWSSLDDVADAGKELYVQGILYLPVSDYETARQMLEHSTGNFGRKFDYYDSTAKIFSVMKG